ncbi:MAG TPA: hypothetical protein DCZ59_00615, partial [Bacteroidetes bacterium]|nr:hypothetical protein [Bacteroidota bacterium]
QRVVRICDNNFLATSRYGIGVATKAYGEITFWCARTGELRFFRPRITTIGRTAIRDLIRWLLVTAEVVVVNKVRIAIT